MTIGQPSVAPLERLFVDGHAKVPSAWELEGPTRAGLWWRASSNEGVATPALLRMASSLSSRAERAGLLLATEPRFRDSWSQLEAARLRALGERGDLDGLCRRITALGGNAASIKRFVNEARLAPTPYAALELGVFGAPADQPAAAPGLARVLGSTAPVVEGGAAAPAAPLPAVDPRDVEVNWVPGRVLQAPGAEAVASPWVLSGAAPACGSDRMAWVLGTPWVTFMSVLAFTMEAWAAERQGGLELELDAAHIQQFSRPPAVHVVVTLADGREVLCGTLGLFSLRVLDGLGMALVPSLTTAALDQQLSDVIAALLKAGVWAWKPEARTRYVIGDRFAFDCYRGEGHRYIFLGSDRLSQVLRSVAITWARALTDGEASEVRP